MKIYLGILSDNTTEIDESFDKYGHRDKDIAFRLRYIEKYLRSCLVDLGILISEGASFRIYCVLEEQFALCAIHITTSRLDLWFR